MKVLGYRISRFLEWWRVVQAEEVGVLDLFLLAVDAACMIIRRATKWTYTPHSGTVIRRYKTCLKCPLYDPGLRRCRQDVNGNRLGCGCYIPFKITATPIWTPCWGHLTTKGKIGWK